MAYRIKDNKNNNDPNVITRSDFAKKRKEKRIITIATRHYDYIITQQ